LRYGVENFKEGLLFFHFFGVDQNSHMLWGKFNDDLLETYKLVDQALGWTMEHAKNASVVVMSDHGFSTFDRAVHLNSWLMKEGFLKLDNPANVGADELFAHVDWTGTQAYALGLNGLYLNLSGRERNGSVDPMESRFVLNKLKERLLQFKDPDTGKQVVDTVYFSRDQFHGAMVDTAPDILVGYGQGFRGSWQTALGAVPKVTVEDNTEAWIGDHCIASHHVPGVLLSNRKSKVSDPALADLPATILSEFGVSPAEGMVGRVIY
jgi:predicted AlkP superfamily phosphohydrolase/phosphomutase